MDPSPPPSERSDVEFIVRATRWAIVLAAVVTVVVLLLWILKGALTPLATAFFIAYLLDPLIDRFEAHGVPRRWIILCLIALLGTGLLLGLFFLIPKLLRDLGALAERLPDYLQQLQEVVIPQLESRFDIELPSTLRDLLQAARTGEIPLPFDAIRSFLAATLGYVTGTVQTLVGLIVIPILSYYILVDFDQITKGAASVIPEAYRAYLLDKARTVNALVAGFLRGQLAVAATLGVLYAVGFSAIGIDLAVGVGLLAGILGLIPYLGNIAAVALASALCILKFGVDGHLLAVLGYYVAVQNFEGFILTPRVIGQSVGLNPATVIVSLLIGGDLFGFLGLLIAVPTAATVKVFLQEILESYRRSALYASPGAGAP
jgi:predicted PurR-regulated permease PerM